MHPSLTGISNRDFTKPHHLVLLLYKFDKENSTKNFQENSRTFGKQPEAGNIFIVKNPEGCTCGVRKGGRRIVGGEEVTPVRQQFCCFPNMKTLLFRLTNIHGLLTS